MKDGGVNMEDFDCDEDCFGDEEDDEDEEDEDEDDF